MAQPNKDDFDVRKVLKREAKGGLKRLHGLIWAWRILHQKMQNFQRRFVYAPVSSEDNVVIENFKKDGVTNNHSNTNNKIVNLTLSEPL
jgi:hypothetical protein